MARKYKHGRLRSSRVQIWMRPELLLKLDHTADLYRYSRDGAFEEAIQDFILKYKGTQRDSH